MVGGQVLFRAMERSDNISAASGWARHVADSEGGSGAVHIDFAVPTISDGTQFDVMFRLVDSLTSPTNELRTGCFTVTVK